jgi:uncharacterized membrane protein
MARAHVDIDNFSALESENEQEKLPMKQMVVAVFDNEPAALEALRELRNLHSEGGVSLYASAVVVKDTAGKVSVKQTADQGPAGLVLGMLVGGLVGVLGGPGAVPLGAYFGGLAGLLFDLGKFGIDLSFFDDVSKALTDGKAAVLAEVEESWTSLLDERLGKHGGTVYRRFRVDVVEDRLAAIEGALPDGKRQSPEARRNCGEGSILQDEAQGVREGACETPSRAHSSAELDPSHRGTHHRSL